VTVEVSGAPAQVLLDGQPVGTSPLKEPLLVRPGKHTIAATRGDQERAEHTAEFLTSTQVTVTLAPKVKEEQQARLIINSEPANAVITINGELRGETPVVATLPAGAHTITAEQDGFATTSTEVSLEAGQSRTILIKMVPGGGLRVATVRARRFPLMGTLVGGGGLALVGVAVAFNLQAQDAARQMTNLFQTGATYDGQARRVEETGHTASALSWMFGVVGGAAFATGVVLVLTELLGSGGDEVSFFFGPTATGGVAATWRASW
jgi:hypothetical protein